MLAYPKQFTGDQKEDLAQEEEDIKNGLCFYCDKFVRDISVLNQRS